MACDEMKRHKLGSNGMACLSKTVNEWHVNIRKTKRNVIGNFFDTYCTSCDVCAQASPHSNVSLLELKCHVMCYGEGLEPRLFLSMYIHVPLKMSYVHVPFIMCHYNDSFDMEGMLGHVRDVAQDFLNGICSYMYVHVHGSVFLEFPVARICMPIMCWSWNVRKSRWYLEPEYRDILHQLPHD